LEVGEARVTASPFATVVSGARLRPVRVFSGIQPTGRKHLGNYLGAIRNYVAMLDPARTAAALHLTC
jgi:hypothetical protein